MWISVWIQGRISRLIKELKRSSILMGNLVVRSALKVQEQNYQQRKQHQTKPRKSLSSRPSSIAIPWQIRRKSERIREYTIRNLRRKENRNLYQIKSRLLLYTLFFSPKAGQNMTRILPGTGSNTSRKLRKNEKWRSLSSIKQQKASPPL